jgi:hypothetical protein
VSQRGAISADAVIHTAFIHNFSDFGAAVKSVLQQSHIYLSCRVVKIHLQLNKQEAMIW